MTKEPPSVLSTLHTIGISLVTLVACCAVRWAFDQYREATREHPIGCICRLHRKREANVAAAGKRRRAR